MNLTINNDIKELIPTFSVIAYTIEFNDEYNALTFS